MQPIVVGVDESRESAAAAAAGAFIARAAGVPCRLFHAAGERTIDVAESVVELDVLRRALLARRRAELEQLLREYVTTDVVTALDVRPGPPGALLAQVASELDAAMVVLGGKRHSLLGRWIGGSTVQQVARRLHVPLLVTAGDLRPRPRVLVAVDASYAAVPTIQRAVTFAQLVGGPLHALHVIEPEAAIGELPFSPAAAHYTERTRERIERDVWTLLPVPDHHKVIRTGLAVETIVQEAAAWRADVIVVGSHGKSWIDRLLIGSVTEDLLNDLPAAVLVVPVPAPERRRALAVQAAAAPA